MSRRHFPRCNSTASRLLCPSLGICANGTRSRASCSERARFPSLLAEQRIPQSQRRRLDICRRLGGPAWPLKRSSDLSALIDGHKPPGSTPRVGKEVPPRKVAFQMLIWGYKYSRGAAEQQRAHLEGQRAAAERLLPSRPVPHRPAPSRTVLPEPGRPPGPG